MTSRTTSSIRCLLAALVIPALTGPSHGQDIRRVNIDTPLACGSPDMDGSTWEKAYKYLQDALAVSDPGDQVWVAGGAALPGRIYYPDVTCQNAPLGSDIRTDTFAMENNVRVYGGFAGTETELGQRNPALNITVLSGQIDLLFGTALPCNNPPPGAGNCCIATPGVGGCTNPTCCQTVCAAMPECCEVAWDSACASFAAVVCSNCGGAGCGQPGAGSCFEEHATLGCDDPFCCGRVCDEDLFCCDTSWDSQCTDLAYDHCFGNSIHVVTATSPVVETAILDGFTISQGGATGVFGAGRGGGMMVTSASPTISGCKFEDNFANDGGAAYLLAGLEPTMPNIVKCSFERNNAGIGSGRAEFGGGAMYMFGARPKFINCTFNENTADIRDGGAVVVEENLADPFRAFIRRGVGPKRG